MRFERIDLYVADLEGQKKANVGNWRRIGPPNQSAIAANTSAFSITLREMPRWKS
jgi:hypothetical protein